MPGQGQEKELDDGDIPHGAAFTAQQVVAIAQQIIGVAGTGADALRQARTSWAIGHEPQTPEEWKYEVQLLTLQAEIKSREDTQKAEVDQLVRAEGHREEQLAGVEKERTDVISKHLRRLWVADLVRSIVLVLVVAAIVAMSFWAIIYSFSLPPTASTPRATARDLAQYFAQFMVPITGIAGAIIGYWFGSRSDSNTQIRDLLRPSQAFEPKPGVYRLSQADNRPVTAESKQTAAATSNDGAPPGV